MTIAVIDLGTNTFHLLIADLLPDGEIKILLKINEAVRLGQDAINKNLIVPTAFERGIQTLKKFRQEIDAHGSERIEAIATSAIRSAKNGQEFVSRAKTEANIDIQVIDGQQEATYIYEAAYASGALEGISLIMDIGGGSTEFILCNQQLLLWKKSYDIGAARLMQAYFNSDPMNEANQAAVYEHLHDVLDELVIACSIYKPSQLIGSAGAFETFAMMVLKLEDVKSLKCLEIPMAGYQTLSRKLLASSHEEREQMPGLIPLRVDMIVIAALITDYVIEHCGISTMRLSTYDLKMGVLQSLKGSQFPV